jgi:hypothetical protein
MWVFGSEVIPSKGDRVRQFRAGVGREGYGWYADQLQVLVKWDDGASSSLRRGDSFAVASSNGASANGAATDEPVPASPATL